VLKINKNTVICTLKKHITLVQVHPNLTELIANNGLEVRLEAAYEADR
jgi:hypothetical protein